ncbi:MAG: fasciclin domain-containing protein [Candidatus Nanopelagicales bacterium]
MRFARLGLAAGAALALAACSVTVNEAPPSGSAAGSASASASTSALAAGPASGSASASASSSTSSSASASASAATSSPAAPTGDMVALTASTPDLSTFNTALQASSIVYIYQEPGPFTMFAPTNAAFAALPAGVLDKLLQPQNQAVLDQVIGYHLAGGEETVSEFANGPIPTVEGSDAYTSKDSTTLKVDSATVTQVDVYATNGVMHTIDQVLIPPDVDLSTLQ